jgi:hypothetical protein
MSRPTSETYIRDASAVPQDLYGVMVAIAEWADLGRDRMDRAYKVKGDIPYDSGLGHAVRLDWVTFTSLCEPQCWALHCPTPGTHMRHFRLTAAGHRAADTLRAKTDASAKAMR